MDTGVIIISVLLAVVGMILSGTVHEWAHAFTAKRLGDDTAERQGRLTLNPTAHIDPIGTILFPALGAAMGGVLFGWARPVPYNPARFGRGVTMRRGTMLVAVAGPLSNLALAVVCALLLRAVVVAGGHPTLENPDTLAALALLLQFGVRINVVLFVFNLLPIPPLDGSKVMAALLGDRHPAVQFVEEYRLWLFIGLLLIGLPLLAVPLSALERLIFSLAVG